MKVCHVVIDIYPKVWTILDPDQAQHFVVPDLGPNCLQRLSADDTRRQRVKWISDSRERVNGCCIFIAGKFVKE